MTATKLLIAVALLTHSHPLVELSNAAALRCWLGPTMQEVAIHWQILDKRETGYILRDSQNLAEDLALLQQRFQRLAGAPRIEECRRFPTFELAVDFLAKNHSYREDLTSRLLFDRPNNEKIRVALREAEHLCQIWDFVRDAQCKYYFISVRRRALQELREKIGAPAYYRGELPPPLPIWRIPRIN